MFYKDERLALLIDGSNLYAVAKSLGFDIDYKKLLDLFANKARLVRAYYYTALVEDQEYSPIRPLVDWLDYNGYTMVTKPTKEFTDATGRRKIKGNMDIELAIDVMEMSDRLDHIVLFSGDGDFRRLVEAVQRKGVRVTVIKDGGDGPDDRIRRGFELCLSRQPTESELKLLRTALNEGLQRFKRDPETANKLLSVGQSPRDPSLDAAELAAYTTLARMLLNLSEFITKG